MNQQTMKPVLARAKSIGCVAALLWAGLGTAAAVLAQTPGALDPVQRRDVLHGARTQLDRLLLLSPKLTLDPELRRAAQAMVDAERPRIDALLSAWLDEARALDPSAGPNLLAWTLGARVLNETALWRLDRVDAAHERLVQQAFLLPRACDESPADGGPLASQVLLAQRLPAAQRAQWLAAETVLMQRWGLPRAAPPPRPVPSLDDVAGQAVDELLDDGRQPELPLTPLLSWWLLDSKAQRSDRLESVTRCALHQWALALAMKQGGGVVPEAAAWAHRYARIPAASDWVAKDTTASATDYPALARTLGVQGTIEVEVILNARGLLRQARIVRRQITVPGLGGRPAVGMDTLLDEPSLARAREMTHKVPTAEQLTNGILTRRIAFDWKMQ